MNKEDLQKQIELLVKDDESSQQTIINQRQEIERLNNIINELEKYIDEKNKIKVETDGYIWQLKRPSIPCKDLKDKMQELKGKE